MGQLYADKEQMLKRYRAEDIADLTQDDETRLNAVLASTSALIDGYVAPAAAKQTRHLDRRRLRHCLLQALLR